MFLSIDYKEGNRSGGRMESLGFLGTEEIGREVENRGKKSLIKWKTALRYNRVIFSFIYNAMEKYRFGLKEVQGYSDRQRK